MTGLRYIEGVASLQLDRDACVGCGMCAVVCPHRVLAVRDKKAEIVDFGACMECGACATNCPAQAVTVTPGVGCAAYIIAGWLGRNTAGQRICC